MARLGPGENGVYDYGPGGVSSRPRQGRHIKIFNDHNELAMFLPERSAAERASVYRNVNKVSTARGYQGQYVVGDKLYRNTAAIGTGPCWSGQTLGEYSTPPEAPSGFTDEGVYNANGVNPNDHSGVEAVRSGTGSADLAWQFYQVHGYGCPENNTAKISVRHCWI